MFDKVIIKGRINTADIDSIVLRNYLEPCTQGDELYYKSTAWANFDGCFIEVRGERIKCKCSINKLYYKDKEGKLDNSKPMTFRNAIRTIHELLLRLYLKPENATVTYYEVGITMKMVNPATTYIEAVIEAANRPLWNDANYPVDRQKTTEKSKNFRKILKMYDKTFESNQKGRIVGSNVLRIESVYRHQSIPLVELMRPETLNKIGRVFYEDWLGMKWMRRLIPPPGAKMSQIDKAREIYRLGEKRYRKKYQDLHKEGKITRKQWETIRNFARSWPKMKATYDEEPTEIELEFQQKLVEQYQVAKTTNF